MTEEDWLAEADPSGMLDFLRTRGTLTHRKARLFAAVVWRLLEDERVRRAVEVIERHAEGLASAEELSSAHEQAWSSSLSATTPHGGPACWVVCIYSRFESAEGNTGAGAMVAKTLESEGCPASTVHSVLGELATLVRDIVPNPFAATPRIDPVWLGWNDGTIPKLAVSAYEERRLPSGELDRERLAVLADALEDVGADAYLIEHLRGPGPHVRGCHVIDLLTGRE